MELFMNIRLMLVCTAVAASATFAWAGAPAKPASPATAPATSPATAPATAPAGALKTEQERIGYAVGVQFGERLKGADLDAAALAAGFRDAAGGKKLQLTDKELDDALDALKGQMMNAAQKAGDNFLAENGKKEGVKTTASGLQYKVIKSGTGKSPKATDKVSVTYRGTLTNGQEFDSSDRPVSFGVNQVIPGWTEALQLMKEGDKWQLFIPSKLAYGERSPGAEIPPNSVLVFEVELLKVN